MKRFVRYGTVALVIGLIVGPVTGFAMARTMPGDDVPVDSCVAGEIGNNCYNLHREDESGGIENCNECVITDCESACGETEQEACISESTGYCTW